MNSFKLAPLPEDGPVFDIQVEVRPSVCIVHVQFRAATNGTETRLRTLFAREQWESFICGQAHALGFSIPVLPVGDGR